jgi:hypothetical protein
VQQQKTYWKQRGHIKWVTLGDASTKFFHAHATVKYRRNFITQLKDDKGNFISDHNEKAKDWGQVISQIYNMIWLLILLIILIFPAWFSLFLNRRLMQLSRIFLSTRHHGLMGSSLTSSSIVGESFPQTSTCFVMPSTLVLYVCKASILPTLLWFQRKMMQLESLTTSLSPS